MTDLGRLDILSEVPPVGSYAEIVTRALILEIYGRPCRVISLDDLIAVKAHLGREKDRLALEELKALRARRNSSEPS